MTRDYGEHKISTEHSDRTREEIILYLTFSLDSVTLRSKIRTGKEPEKCLLEKNI